MMKDLVIIGAGGHGKVIADIAQKMGKYEKIFFLDDAVKGNCMDFPVLGKTNLAFSFLETVEIFIAIGNAEIRAKFLEALIGAGAKIPILIHPNTSIGANVSIGVGTVLMPGAIINPESKIGKGCIINTASSVDHECEIDNYVHVAVGAHLCGNVKIGKYTWIGAGATVSNNIAVCSRCMIGAGSVVVGDVKAQGTYIGVPAKKQQRRVDDENIDTSE